MKPLVMDLGMHNGDDTAAYLAQGFRVVAVEADPAQTDRAKTRFASAISSYDLTLECCGLGPVDGERTFYRSATDYWSSFDAGLAGRRDTRTEAITVPCRKPKFLFKHYGVPHYVKIDIEGSDRCVLDAIAAFGLRPRFLSVEISHCDDIDAVAALGYTRFAVVDQSKLSPNGNPSGPFGDAITEPWVDLADAIRLYSDGRADPTSWFDLHAR